MTAVGRQKVRLTGLEQVSMIVFDVLYRSNKFVEIFNELKFRRTCPPSKFYQKKSFFEAIFLDCSSQLEKKLFIQKLSKTSQTTFQDQLKILLKWFDIKTVATLRFCQVIATYHTEPSLKEVGS